MTLYTVIFYILAILTLVATALAVTRRQPVHAVIYLIIAFLGTALLFYLLGAPLLALFEVIIYAGAIMVLFVFIIMMLELAPSEPRKPTPGLRWTFGIVLGLVGGLIAGTLIVSGAAVRNPLETAIVSPLAFGKYLLQHYWLSVEIASLLLLVALVGAFYMGRRGDTMDEEVSKEK
jgi:NADH-quinone oxidoreductase subunit J